MNGEQEQAYKALMGAVNDLNAVYYNSGIDWEIELGESMNSQIAAVLDAWGAVMLAIWKSEDNQYGDTQ